MSRGVNQCNFIGNLGADPLCFESKDGKDITKISIAVNRRKDNESHVVWVPILSFGFNATFIKSYLKKGDLVYVSGELSPTERKLPSGEVIKTYIIISNQVISLNNDNHDSSSNGNHDRAPSIQEFDDVPF